MIAKQLRLARLAASFAMIRGALHLIRVNDVVILRMTTDPGFDPTDFDGMRIRVCPVGESPALNGVLRFHATSNERRSMARLRLIAALPSGERVMTHRLPLSPVVRAVCARTIGFRIVFDRPMGDIGCAGVVVFIVTPQVERSVNYRSAEPPVEPLDKKGENG